ncbi:hypothetical protein C7B77_24330 [Chamaesiphon polymorphus CCALA 037]|uniref:Uncharacterized protein n=1 Tax=Chamaesiphon polymorphus CCALA 037 TaxID=2107692 RepID=A0A2T1FR68_9CYAN|nr:hypothetical protein C7B77_24330 [Chamaesiphon polymorphus CCALA 037]
MFSIAISYINSATPIFARATEFKLTNIGSKFSEIRLVHNKLGVKKPQALKLLGESFDILH